MQSQLPQKGQLIDYKQHTSSDYTACLVQQVKGNQLQLKQMDKNSSPSFQAQYSKIRMKPFRTESKCKKDSYFYLNRIRILSSLNHQQNLQQLKKFVKVDIVNDLSPSQIISFLRGHNFWYIKRLQLFVASSRQQITSILQYIQAFLDLVNKYISNFQPVSQPKDIYKNTNNALNSCYSEIFINLMNIFALKSKEKFIRENSAFLNEEDFQFYYEWFENQFLPTLTTKNLNLLIPPIYERLFDFILHYLKVKQEVPVVSFFKDIFHKILEQAFKGNIERSFLQKLVHSHNQYSMNLRKFIAENQKEYEELKVKIKLSTLRFREKCVSFEFATDLKTLTEYINNEKYRNITRQWLFGNNIIKEMLKFTISEPRIIDNIRELFFKDALYESREKKLFTLKYLLQNLQFESNYGFKFFQSVLIYANELQKNIEKKIEAKVNSHGRTIEIINYQVLRPMFGLHKIYTTFKNIKPKLPLLRRQMLQFFNKLLFDIVNPQLRKEMVSYHIQKLIEIINFDNQIELQKNKEQFVTDVTKYLKQIFEFYKRQPFAIFKFMQNLKTLFVRLPETEKLWQALPIRLNDWDRIPDLIQLKDIFFHHQKLNERDNEYELGLWNSILNCDEKREIVLSLILKLQIDEQIDWNWIFDTSSEIDSELAILNNIKSIQIMRKFKIPIDNIMMNRLLQMMKIAQSNSSDDEDQQLQRSMEYEQLLKSFKSYLDEYADLDLFEYFIEIDQTQLKQIHSVQRLSQFIYEIWELAFEEYSFEKKKRFFLQNFPSQISNHINNFEKFLNIFINARINRQEDIIYINTLEYSIYHLVKYYNRMEYKLSKVLLSLISTLLKKRYQSQALYSELFLMFLQENLYSNFTPFILQILTHLVSHQVIAEKYINRFISQINEPQWERQQKFKVSKRYLKGPTGYIGLRNPHSICYINSFMQQIFHIREFKKQIFQTKWKQTETKDEDLVYQMKKIFLNLQERQIDFYYNYQFFSAFKDQDGRNTPVDIQMDVDEFRNILLDRIENLIIKKDGEDKNFIQKLFNGKQVTFIKSKQCEHESKRQQDFSSICVQVKGYQNLQRSLQNYFKKQILEKQNSYNCQDCRKKVVAEKSLQILQYPSYLTVVLKRFEYTYSHRLKINSKFQFPFNEFRFDENTKYQLRGIIVHQGMSEVGHYFSLIKLENKWFQFNDHLVEEVKESFVKKCGFGEDSYYSNKNAYLLIYKKCQNVRKQEQEFHYEGLRKQRFQIQKLNKLTKKMHVYFSQKFELLVQRLVYYGYAQSDKLFLDYILLIKCKISTIHQCMDFKRLFDQVKVKNGQSLIGSRSNLHKIVQFYINSTINPSIKGMFTRILIHSQGFSQNMKELVKIFMYYMYEDIESAQFFEFFYQISKVDPQAIKYFVESRIVGRILQISISNLMITQIRKQIREKCETDAQFGTIALEGKSKDSQKIQLKYHKWRFLNFILESRCKLIKQEQQILYHHSERKMKKIFQDGCNKANINQISKLFCLLSERNQFFGKSYLSFICEAISKEKSDQLRKYLKAAKDLLKFDDHLKKERIGKITNSFFTALQSFSEMKVPSSFDIVWQWFLKIGAKNEEFREEIGKRKKNFMSIFRGFSSIPTIRPQISKQEQKLKNRFNGLKFSLTISESTALSHEKIAKTDRLLNNEQMLVTDWDSDDDLTEEQLKKEMLIMRYDEKGCKFVQAHIDEVCGDVVIVGNKKYFKYDDSLTKWFDNETQSNKTQLN